MKQTLTFHASGMHCKACSILIEETLKELPNIDDVRVSLSGHTVTVTGEFEDTPEEIASDLTELVEDHGYVLSVEKRAHLVKWADFAYAIPAALILIAGFILLQKVGLADLITSSEVSYGTAFFIGLIASVSSCLAIVGGLVLSISASEAKEGSTWRSITLFHIGRFAGFFLLGGAVGMLGSSFHLGITASVVLSVIVALVMLILGINLLDIFHFTKKLQITMPTHFSKYIFRGTNHEHYIVPALVGIGTFFLPCGFTQSMQLYALSTGSFTEGSLTMLVFALGTFPMLALLSFSSVSITNKPWKGIFFKTAGIIVIVLALLNVASALATAGIINPLFNF